MSWPASEVEVFAPYLVGNGIDVCCGHRVWPGAVGIDKYEYQSDNPDFPKCAAHWHFNALDLPFKDGTLDYVFCSHGLEHVGDVGFALCEWSRVLRPGGHLCCLTPDINHCRLPGTEVPHGLEPSTVAKALEDIHWLEVVRFDTLKNDLVFDLVARRL